MNIHEVQYVTSKYNVKQNRARTENMSFFVVLFSTSLG